LKLLRLGVDLRERDFEWFQLIRLAVELLFLLSEVVQFVSDFRAFDLETFDVFNLLNRVFDSIFGEINQTEVLLDVF
jgi:hypothetical protein